jgi:glycosyltransferase involved in cell wall biosynthesis
MLNVLMQNRADAFEYPGGDTVSMLHLRERLIEMGVSIDVSLELEPDCSSYDVVSLFNIMRVHETYVQFRNAKRQSKRIVVMPICWDFSELDRKGRGYIARGAKKVTGQNGFEFIKNMVRIAKDSRQRRAFRYQFLRSYTQQQREIVSQADIVTPNSNMEADILKNKAGVFKNRVVFNGVEPETFLRGDGKRFKEKYNIPYEKFGLCVGRFDYRKNQMSLIRAIRDERIPIVFIGDPGSNYRPYFDKCRREAFSLSFVFLSHMSHADLADAYAAAHMHAQPSWLETPGLTNLEAGLSGCNLAISDRGSVREYFKNSAWYCEPDCLHSIRNAVASAFEAPRGSFSELKARILDNFTWEKSARAMLSVYHEVVGSRV